MSRVAAVTVREGDPVRTGQVLVRLESADLSAQARQAEAALAAAGAALAQAEASLEIQRTQSSTRVLQAEAALQQARAALSMVREGSRRQQKIQAEESVRQAEAARAQAEEGVLQVTAAQAAAHARLSLVREGARRQQKLQADAALRQAEVGLKIAQSTYDRHRLLADEGAISRQRLDEVALSLEVARSQYETAQQQTSLVYEGARAQEVQQAEEAVRQADAATRSAQQKAREAQAALGAARAQRDLTFEGARTQEVHQAQAQEIQASEALRMAQAATSENKIKRQNVRMLRAQASQAAANLAAARVQLAYATLVAPFSGVIIRRLVDPGAMAAPGVPLLSLVDPSSFRLEALVPESQIRGVHLGARVPVTIDALARRLTGRVTQIVPSADPASRTFVIKVSLPNGRGLSQGLFGRAKIVVGKTTGIFVPESALWQMESLTGVFVISETKVHRRLVTIGEREGGNAEILSGLRGGEVVVARGVDRLQDGAPIRRGGES